jgi:hypothetical protein
MIFRITVKTPVLPVLVDIDKLEIGLFAEFMIMYFHLKFKVDT